MRKVCFTVSSSIHVLSSHPSGIFEVEGKDYIALEALDGTDDVYLYGYKPVGDDFELLDLDEETFEKVAAEFESLCDEPL